MANVMLLLRTTQDVPFVDAQLLVKRTVDVGSAEDGIAPQTGG